MFLNSGGELTTAFTNLIFAGIRKMENSRHKYS